MVLTGEEMGWFKVWRPLPEDRFIFCSSKNDASICSSVCSSESCVLFEKHVSDHLTHTEISMLPMLSLNRKTKVYICILQS